MSNTSESRTNFYWLIHAIQGFKTEEKTGDKVTWNTKLVEFKSIEQLSDSHELIYHVYKSFNSPYKYRDFTLLRSWRSVEPITKNIPRNCKSYRIVSVSVCNHPELPDLVKNRIRTVLLPTGWVIEPVTLTSSRVTFVAQMTNDSVCFSQEFSARIFLISGFDRFT